MASVSRHLLDKNTNDNAIPPTLLSVERPTLQGSADVRFPTVYAILIGTLEGNMVEYATQWFVGSSTHISRMSKIRRYTTDGKKKCCVKNSIEKCQILDMCCNLTDHIRLPIIHKIYTDTRDKN